MVHHVGAADPSASAPASGAGSQQHYEVDTRIGPAAAKLLREHGLSADTVKPTGPHNMVTKGDVLAALEAGLTAPKPQATSVPLPTSSFSACIAPYKDLDDICMFCQPKEGQNRTF